MKMTAFHLVSRKVLPRDCTKWEVFIGKKRVGLRKLKERIISGKDTFL